MRFLLQYKEDKMKNVRRNAIILLILYVTMLILELLVALKALEVVDNTNFDVERYVLVGILLYLIVRLYNSLTVLVRNPNRVRKYTFTDEVISVSILVVISFILHYIIGLFAEVFICVGAMISSVIFLICRSIYYFVRRKKHHFGY